MHSLIDNWLPWFGDLLILGGDILALILLLACGMWALICERLYYLYVRYPQRLAACQQLWRDYPDKMSWYAHRYRAYLSHLMAAELGKSFSIIGTFIKVCPLLGLLGTVAGMLEVFDALAATGSNNPRSMAAGVSKATVSTLAGMVVAIFGLLSSKLIERKAALEQEKLPARFGFEEV